MSPPCAAPWEPPPCPCPLAAAGAPLPAASEPLELFEDSVLLLSGFVDSVLVAVLDESLVVPAAAGLPQSDCAAADTAAPCARPVVLWSRATEETYWPWLVTPVGQLADEPLVDVVSGAVEDVEEVLVVDVVAVPVSDVLVVELVESVPVADEVTTLLCAEETVASGPAPGALPTATAATASPPPAVTAVAAATTAAALACPASRLATNDGFIW